MAQATGSLAPHRDLLEPAGAPCLSHNWKPFVYVVRAVSPRTEKLTPRRRASFFNDGRQRRLSLFLLVQRGYPSVPQTHPVRCSEQGCSFRIIPNEEKGIGLYLSVSPITGRGDYSQKRGGDFEEGLSLQPKTIPREALSADLLGINAAEVGGMVTQVLMRGEGSRQSSMAAAIRPGPEACLSSAGLVLQLVWKATLEIYISSLRFSVPNHKMDAWTKSKTSHWLCIRIAMDIKTQVLFFKFILLKYSWFTILC